MLIEVFLICDNKFMIKALITGITGQDGSYLAEFLIDKGYEVHGIKRRSSIDNTGRLKNVYKDLHIKDRNKLYYHHADLTESSSIIRIIQSVQPDEIYNLAAQSHVAVSFETPEYTANSDALGTLRILEAIRILKLEKKIKFYQASTSELYGLTKSSIQNEITPFHPRSPYGVAKLYAHWITINYREAFNIFACNGILFNHESPRRGETFVTRKITKALTRIKLGLQDTLFVGNLNAKRDWGHAKDYVEAMWLILQHSRPEDFVIATGQQFSVREFINFATQELGIKIEWDGIGINEVGYCNGKAIVKVDSNYFRPAEVDTLLGDSSKAKKILNWKPKISFLELVREMIENDLALANEELKKKNIKKD